MKEKGEGHDNGCSMECANQGLRRRWIPDGWMERALQRKVDG